MKLTALELAGFKSFAAKTSLEFDDGITAVIGPNGSGKSNVAEAIRWVLGEQSLKQLRGKERTDVIFSGSSEAKRRGSARVTITLNNETGRLKVDAPEVSISRTLNRSGESEYLINGDPVRLFDVQHLLAGAGLGARSYAVISQGMVDQYLTATPAGRRELFDEATGIRALQLKLVRAQAKLKQVGTHLEQLHTVVRELEPRLAVLKRQAQRHAKREQLLETFDSAQKTYFHQMWHASAQEVEQITATVAATSEEVAKARSAREAAENALVASARQSSSDSNLIGLQDQLRRAEADFKKASVDYEQKLAERAKLEDSLQQVRNNLAQAETQLAQAREATTEDSFFTTVHNTLNSCSALIERLRQNKAVAEVELAELTDQLAEAQQLLATEMAGMKSTQSLWQQLEGPLQAVARLQAIEQERRDRLASTPEPTKPSPAEVERLRTAIEAGSSDGDATEEQSRTKMDETREIELAAARAASAAAAAAEQATQQLANLEGEILRERGTAFLSEIQQQAPDVDPVSQENVQQIAGQLAAIGEIDPLALREYEEVQARYDDLQTQLQDANHARENAEQLVASLEATMAAQFKEQFEAIRSAFQEHFHVLFGGGAADLQIVAPETDTRDDVAEADKSTPVSGVEILVHPPGKKPSHINLLSGGEKALTSLALLLAIVHVQQPPFVVLDEVDAALDEANSFRCAEMLQTLKTHTQCVVITHNRETMGQADVLYGITMQQDGISHVYSVKLEEIASLVETNS